MKVQDFTWEMADEEFREELLKDVPEDRRQRVSELFEDLEQLDS